MNVFWGIFTRTDARSRFSNWKKAKRRPKDGEDIQLISTQWLLRVFQGKADQDILSSSLFLYLKCHEYWKSQHSDPLNDVLIYLKSHCNDLEKIKEDTERAKRQDRLRAINPLVARDNWGVLPPTPKPCDELEATGDNAAALRCLKDRYFDAPEWLTFLHILRLTESGGHGSANLDEIQQFRAKLVGEPDQPLRAAEDFYMARLLGQKGDFAHALALHRDNMNQSQYPALYGLLSQFEIAQLHFRLENFSRSKCEFLKLFELLPTDEPVGTLPWPITKLRVDVLKFLGTFERLHFVFDAPCAEVTLPLSVGSPAKCVEMARQAIDLSDHIGYRDGTAWGHTVHAFGLEREEVDECERAYDRALNKRHHSGQNSHASSRPYILLYRAGMLRRRRKFDEANRDLCEVRTSIGEHSRLAHLAELNTQCALLAKDMNDSGAAKAYQLNAIRLLGSREGLRQQ
jgi:tetratricopeptide (TPR) repeat protein